MGASRNRLTLNWYSPVWGHYDGYGNAAEQIVRALERRGHLVGITHQKDMHFHGPVDRSWIEAHPKRLTQQCVWFTLPTTWMCTHRYNVGFSMYESSVLPAEWQPALHNVDEVWVPSTHCRTVFARYTDRPIYVIPLGVNPTLFSVRRERRGPRIRLLHICAQHNSFRKGADLAVKSFLQAFPGDEGVELVIQAASGDPPESPDPRISYTREPIAQQNFADYFSAFDALLYTSRGEGFGLLALEAAATGLPIFHSGETGMRDYAHIGTVVAAREAPAVTQEGTWYEIDAELLARALRAFRQDAAPYRQKALQDAELIKREFSWDSTAERIERRLITSALPWWRIFQPKRRPLDPACERQASHEIEELGRR